MTGKSGVGIFIVQQTTFQLTCHSEPVLRLVWESPPYSRPRLKLRVIPNQCAHWCGNLPRHRYCNLLKMEIAEPVCALVRNDLRIQCVVTTTHHVRHDLSAGTAGHDLTVITYGTIPSGSGWERLQTTFVTTCLPALPAENCSLHKLYFMV